MAPKPTALPLKASPVRISLLQTITLDLSPIAQPSSSSFVPCAAQAGHEKVLDPEQHGGELASTFSFQSAFLSLAFHFRKSENNLQHAIQDKMIFPL